LRSVFGRRKLKEGVMSQGEIHDDCKDKHKEKGFHKRKLF